MTTETFRCFSTKREYCTKPDNLNCCSSNVVHLFSCKACSKQYAGSTESLRSRFTNYKLALRNFIKRNTVKLLLLLLLPLLFYLFISFKIYLVIYFIFLFFIYLFIYLYFYWYVDLFGRKGVLLLGFLTLGCCELKE